MYNLMNNSRYRIPNLLCTLSLQTEHCSPWLMSPYSILPQWSQNVGLEQDSIAQILVIKRYIIENADK